MFDVEIGQGESLVILELRFYSSLLQFEVDAVILSPRTGKYSTESIFTFVSKLAAATLLLLYSHA